MVSGQVWSNRGEVLPESPQPGAPAVSVSGPNLPVPTRDPPDETNVCTVEITTKTGRKKQKPKSEKKYLGVRVRMPVRDMLKNIRIAKGIDPKDLGKHSKANKGDKKRVNTSVNHRNCLKEKQTKGLEELAIIVEVLEEDLKTCQPYRSSNKRLSNLYYSEYKEKFWGDDLPQQGFMSNYDQENEFPVSPSYSVASEKSSVPSVSSPYPSLAYNQGTDVFFGCEAECGIYEADDHSPQQEEWSSMTFFWAQIEREGNLLKEISDQDLLAVDKNGRTFLHRVVEEGKRALAYIIAKRMATLKKLDVKDLEGKTPLHLAAQRNQHFMVSDLVSLGANINEKDSYGKMCLHLSAENGYVRVLEVLKSFMRNGVYINLEERDANGLSALQCAAAALNNTVRELKLCKSAGQVRLHTLREEQMMETLECLLQMEYYLHALDQVHLNGMKRGVNSKPYEAASCQSNEIKAISNMT